MVDVEAKLKGLKKEKEEAKSRGFKIILVTIFIAIFAVFISRLNLFVISLSIATIIIFFLYVLYYIWSPVRYVGYKIEETYCLLIMEGGAYKRADLQWAGHTLTEDGWVVPEREEDGSGILSEFDIVPKERIKKPASHRGLRLFQLLGLFEAPLVDTLNFFRYDPRTEEVVEVVGLIWKGWFVVPYNYGLKINQIYTEDGVPCSFNMGLLGQLMNPFIAQFVVKNWYESFTREVHGVVFDIISSSTYDELKAQTDLAGFFYQRFKEVQKNKNCSLVKRCLMQYGIHIMGVQIGKLTWPSDIVNAADEEEKEQLIKKAANVKAAADQDVLVIEASAIDRLVAQRLGLTPEELTKAIKDQDFFAKYEKLRKAYRKDILDIMAIKNGTGVRVSSKNALVDAAAVLSTLNNQSQRNNANQGGSEGSDEKKGGKIFDKKTREILKKAGIPVELEDEI